MKLYEDTIKLGKAITQFTDFARLQKEEIKCTTGWDNHILEFTKDDVLWTLRTNHSFYKMKIRSKKQNEGITTDYHYEDFLVIYERLKFENSVPQEATKKRSLHKL